MTGTLQMNTMKALHSQLKPRIYSNFPQIHGPSQPGILIFSKFLRTNEIFLDSVPEPADSRRLLHLLLQPVHILEPNPRVTELTIWINLFNTGQEYPVALLAEKSANQVEELDQKNNWK